MVIVPYYEIRPGNRSGYLLMRAVRTEQCLINERAESETRAAVSG